MQRVPLFNHEDDMGTIIEIDQLEDGSIQIAIDGDGPAGRIFEANMKPEKVLRMTAILNTACFPYQKRST